MHFLLAGGSSSSSEELSIVRSITSTFFLLASLATVTEQGLLRTLEPACKEQKKQQLKVVTQTPATEVLTMQHASKAINSVPGKETNSLAPDISL